MDIVPIITKDNLSKEQIEYLQKQQTEYKLVNKIKKNPDCYYDQALNKKNFRKKLKRIGLLSV